jgi:hypothetical protein
MVEKEGGSVLFGFFESSGVPMAERVEKIENVVAYFLGTVVKDGDKYSTSNALGNINCKTDFSSFLNGLQEKFGKDLEDVVDFSYTPPKFKIGDQVRVKKEGVEI